jgi:hypothetical protein
MERVRGWEEGVWLGICMMGRGNKVVAKRWSEGCGVE